MREWRSLQPLPPEQASTSRNLTFRVVQTCHLQTTSPWLSFLCGPNSQHPFHPLPTQPLSQKSPSHDEQSFTGPHLLTYLASQQLSLKMLKHSLLARWRSVVLPRDTQEEPLPSPPPLQQVQRQGSMTSLYQMEEVWGV